MLSIVLNNNLYERYIGRYIVLEDFPEWYGNLILAHMPGILSDIQIFDMKTPPLIWYESDI